MLQVLPINETSDDNSPYNAISSLALDPTKDVETLWLRSIDAVQRAGIAGPGDRVVITSGTNVNRPGATNTILVQTL
jgi:pyruvate kinase